MIDISKIRPGDEVTVRAKVIHAPTSVESSTTVLVGGAQVWIGSSTIASHTPAPREIKVGDWVDCGADKKMKVVAIDDGMAWLRFRDGHKTICVSALAHAENDDGR